MPLARTFLLSLFLLLFFSPVLPPLVAQDSLEWQTLQTELETATQAYSYGDFDSSIPIFERYMQAALERGAHSSYLEALIYRAHAFAYTNEPQKGYELLEKGRAYQAKQLADATDWPIKLDYMEGQIATLDGEHLRGLAALKRADTALARRDSMDYELAAAISQNIGFLYDELGDRATSVAYLQAAVDFFLQHENRDPGYLHVYYNFLSSALAALGDLSKAELYLDEGMRIVQAHAYIPNFYLSSALIQKGDLYYDARQFEQAISFYQQGLDSIRANPQINASDSAHAHTGIGNAYMLLKRYEEALFHQQLAVSAAEKDEGQVFIQLPSFYHNLAETYEMLGQQQARFNVLKKSLGFVETQLPEQHRHRTAIYAALGKWHIEQGEWKEGMGFFQKALIAAGASVEAEDPYAVPQDLPIEFGPSLVLPIGQKIQGHMLRFRAEGNIRDLQTAHALRFLGEKALRDMQQGIQAGWGRRALSSRMVSFYESALEATLLLFEASGDPVYLEEAFQLAETASARLLSLTLQDSRAKSFTGVDDQLLERERSLKRDLAAVQMQLNREPTDALKQHRFHLRQQLDSLVLGMEKSYPAYYSLKYAPSQPRLQELQQQLSRDRSLCVRYFWGEEVAYSFVILPDTLLYFRYQTASLSPDLELLQLQLRDERIAQERAGSPEAFRDFAGPASRLYQRLLAPIEPHLTAAEAVLIVPDGPLSFLPFEVLLTESVADQKPSYTDLPYLFSAHQLRYLYAASLIVDPTRYRFAHQYAGFAPTYEATGEISAYRSLYPELGALSNNVEGVTRISKLMDGQAFLAEEATEQMFRANASEYGVLHMSMHALFNHSDPMYSGLVFSLPSGNPESLPLEKDGILHAYELYTLDLRAQLAVLSACQTGDGAWQRGEGVASLARAFRYAGCPNIVMSLWEAEDEATSALMGHFFQRLNEGLARPEALRKARLDFLAETDRRHPHFWASFVYMGDGLPLQKERSKWPFILAGLFCGLIVMLILRRKKKA